VNWSHKLTCHVNGIQVIGNTRSPYIAIVYYDRIPEYPPLSRPVHPRPAQEAPERKKIL
jgi:hypothetical protein